jgi:excisionase family DNA binding protein
MLGRMPSNVPSGSTRTEANFPATDGERVVLPPDELDQLLDLARFLEGHTEPGLLLGPDGEQKPLPIEVYRVLVQVVEIMRRGQAILVAPQGMLLTTQEAGDFLGLSRPTIVRLLESGEIPFERPNRHRRVRIQDLVTFQQRRRIDRRNTLDRLTEEAGELGLYDGSRDDYLDALRAARSRRNGVSNEA